MVAGMIRAIRRFLLVRQVRASMRSIDVLLDDRTMTDSYRMQLLRQHRDLCNTLDRLEQP